MEHTPKINKVEVRTLQMADYRQLSQSFTRVYSDGLPEGIVRKLELESDYVWRTYSELS